MLKTCSLILRRLLTRAFLESTQFWKTIKGWDFLLLFFQSCIFDFSPSSYLPGADTYGGQWSPIRCVRSWLACIAHKRCPHWLSAACLLLLTGVHNFWEILLALYPQGTCCFYTGVRLTKSLYTIVFTFSLIEFILSLFYFILLYFTLFYLVYLCGFDNCFIDKLHEYLQADIISHDDSTRSCLVL